MTTTNEEIKQTEDTINEQELTMDQLIAQQESLSEKLYKKEIVVTDINLLLIDEITEPMEVEVKTRYSAKVAKAQIMQNGNEIKVIFDEPQRAITPGQSAVFYVGDIVLGGGKIK